VKILLFDYLVNWLSGYILIARSRYEMPGKRLAAIKNFDEELYRLVKTCAALENRTTASVIEEAVRNWLASRRDYDEILAWVRLERGYQKNLDALRRLGERRRGYALICNGEAVEVFDEYLDAVRRSLEIQAPQATIVKLPLGAKPERLELGMP